MKYLQSIVADNIKRLRRANRLTQLEFAEKINYSDKTVSKWETGESIPNMEAAVRIVAFFGITLDDLVREDLPLEHTVPLRRNVNRLVIALLAISAVWIIATIAFVYANLTTMAHPWLIFIYAVPISAGIALVFNTLWGHKRANYVIASVLLWTLLATVYLKYLSFNIWVLFLAGIPLQIAVILWSQLKTRH